MLSDYAKSARPTQLPLDRPERNFKVLVVAEPELPRTKRLLAGLTRLRELSQVVLASSEEDAEREARALMPEVVLVDCHLPNHRGTATVMWLTGLLHPCRGILYAEDETSADVRVADATSVPHLVPLDGLIAWLPSGLVHAAAAARLRRLALEHDQNEPPVTRMVSRPFDGDQPFAAREEAFRQGYLRAAVVRAGTLQALGRLLGLSTSGAAAFLHRYGIRLRKGGRGVP